MPPSPRSPPDAVPPTSSATLPAGMLEEAAALVRGRTGLVFSEARRSAFETGLQTAMRQAGLRDPDLKTYLARLAVEPALLDDLVAEITVGETYFFREPRQLTVLRGDILPALLFDRPPDRPLRVWSAGCASGEEPYTVAIMLREMGADRGAHIVGTDLSRAALAKAHRGRYTRWSLRGAPEHAVGSYFTPVGNEFELAAAVRAAVEFRYLNLAEDTYPSFATGVWGMDVILCRNVLIYFDGETVGRAARRLIDCLSEDGWLLLGSSDPMLADLVRCEVVVTGAGLAYRRASVRKLAAPEMHAPPIPSPPLEPAPDPAPELSEPAPPLRASDDPAEAARCYAARDYGRAAELAAALVQRDGSDPLLWIVLVRALANRGELDAAGRACAAAIDRHRASAEITYLHAVLLAEAGRFAEAATAARRALYLDRGLVVAHLALGGALARLADTAGAHRAFRNAGRLLAAMAAGDMVPASDGEPAGRLAEMARVQMQLLPEPAA